MQDEVAAAIVSAIWTLRAEVEWKPGKDIEHLAKRKIMEHLPPGTTLDEYRGLILDVLDASASRVYCYDHKGTPYGAVVGQHSGRDWLVIFTLAGVIETAFPPTHTQQYITRRKMRLLGTVEELLK